MKSICPSLTFLIFCSVFFLSSCSKGPGEGGNSSIKGHVWVKDINATFQVQAQYDGYDEEVYLIYGDDISFSERIRSSYDGVFEFKYLRPGKYKVFIYSEDSVPPASNPNNVTILKEIEISGKKQQVDAGTFNIFK
ncbi:MAG: hypothetical protein IT233_01810 [Bacteroidia bacterium]|nr:hypothetical protein [Bacteroidia bacterium]